MSDLKPFTDPVLKEALARTLGQEKAPATLRDRLAKLADETRAEEAPADREKPIPIRSWRRNPLYSLAAAAVLLVALGTVAWMVLQSQSTPAGAAISLPPALAQAVVTRHDLCCAMPDHHAIPGNNLSTLGLILASDLHRTIWHADLGGDGWKFHGAGECPVVPAGQSTTISGHLVFAKADNSHVSIFSLPASLLPGKDDGALQETVIGNHRLAGFRKGGGLYIVVMDQPGSVPTAQQVDAVISAHKDEMTAPQTAARPASPLAELMYDVR